MLLSAEKNKQEKNTGILPCAQNDNSYAQNDNSKEVMLFC
jgi:hypothetical protein